ncbi:MAG: peptide deformylase [Chloroflexi bacterium]|nr:peptide deformylase [Chloroflexota bacterium]
MAVLKVRTTPDPVLRKKSKRISTIDASIKKLASSMIETTHDCAGVGLAAPQVGISLRLIVICPPEQEELVLINPEVVRRKGERVVHEGCLSIPGYFGEVKRAESVVVKGLDLAGKGVRVRGEGLVSQALEHEIDHLNGLLYIDRLESPECLYKVEAEEAKPQP